MEARIFGLMAIAICLSQLSDAASIDSRSVADGMSYLLRYGYLPPMDPRSGRLRSVSELKAAVKEFQRFAGLPETGDITDPKTMEKMAAPRCGVADFGPADNARRKRRYALQGSYWNKKDLTWRLENITPYLTRDQIRQTMTTAFQMWSNVSPLTFQEIQSGEADIMIKFVRGYHNDGYPMDGLGGELAHAFYPHTNYGISGDAHFDLDEKWTLGGADGTDLLWVAVHELGHSLGLDHSNVLGAIMYPWYQGYMADFKLTPDDVMGLQQIYGMPEIKRHTPAPTAAPTVKPGLPDACLTTLDAIFESSNGNTYAFKGINFWTIGDNGVEAGPENIKSHWKGLRAKIDAAYTRPDGKTVLFKGERYWVFNGVDIETGPLSIQQYGLPPELKKLDAVFVWGGNGRTYFFKGDKYWRYDEMNNRIDYGYPRFISEAWRGVPSDIDAAFKWRDGRTYFFKGNHFWKLNDTLIAVEEGYPKRIAEYWMGCGKEALLARLDTRSAAFSVLPSSLLLISGLLLTRWF